LGGQGKTAPIGRGMPVGGVSQAPSGLSGPGRGVGVPFMMQMMPTMGRGATPIPQNINAQRLPIQQNIQMGMMQSNIQIGGGMIRPQLINPMMIKPPTGNYIS
jgi:hypothetical protein